MRKELTDSGFTEFRAKCSNNSGKGEVNSAKPFQKGPAEEVTFTTTYMQGVYIIGKSEQGSGFRVGFHRQLHKMWFWDGRVSLSGSHRNVDRGGMEGRWWQKLVLFPMNCIA